MRPRFSLRALLIFTAVLAVFCYYWVIRPTQTAKQFVHAVNSEDYTTADQLTWQASDLSFTKWKDERWGFVTDAALAPWSFTQLLHGTRDVNLHMKYFQLDQNYDVRLRVTATSLRMKKPDTVSTNNGSVIDSTQRSSTMNVR